MATVTVAAVAKKVAAALASNKKGRKFIGYVIGISVFILCIPILVVYCVFGWMSGSDGVDLNNAAAGAIHSVFSDPAIVEKTDTIELVFAEHGLPESDIHKAQIISITFLTGREDDDNFYENLLLCFTEATEEKNVYVRINETFDVSITEEDMQRFDQLYGETLPRITDSGGG